MFSIDNDMTISITRGDVATIPVSAVGEAFKLGDIIRIKVFEKKNCANVIFQKDFGVAEETENFELVLTRNETKIGETINKPKTYWYEIELNPDTSPNTIVGYDEDGPKLFVLYPEGEDIEYIPPTEEEVGPIDYELSLTSKKPIANHVVAKRTLELDKKIDESAENEAKTRKNEIALEKAELETAIETEKSERKAEIAVERARITNLAKLKEGSTTGDAELSDMRVDFTGNVHENAGESVRNQLNELFEITGTGKNLFNPYDINFADGYRIDTTGELVADSNFMTTGYIPIEFGKKYYIIYDFNNMRTGLTRAYCIYDKDFNILEVWSSPTLVNLKTGMTNDDENAKYVRVSIYSNKTVNTVTNVQMEEGQISDYEPFYYKYRLKENVTSDELKDLRLAFSGIVYETAGESVRIQIGELTKYLNEIFTKSKNEFNCSSTIPYKQITNVGSITDSANPTVVSEKIMIPITETNAVISYVKSTGEQVLVDTAGVSAYYYGENDEYLGTSYGNHTIPTGSKYVVLWFRTSSYYEALDRIQYEFGDDFTELKPYGDITFNTSLIEEYVDEKTSSLVVNDTNPLSRLNEIPKFITMFRKIGCIGDSLTSGVINTTSPDDTNNITFKEFSYPSIMEKLTGVEVVNLGAGGSTAGMSHQYNWIYMMENGLRFPTTDFAANPCDAYIIALGTNDITQFNGEFTGIVNDAGVLDTQSSVGGYSEIIRRIKTIQPKAKIFCVTIPKTRNTEAQRTVANQKIKDLANYYGCYVIDLETYDIDTNEFIVNYKNGSHNNALGYNLRARQYIAYIDWIIGNNLDDFRNVSFIGTEYDYSD